MSSSSPKPVVVVVAVVPRQQPVLRRYGLVARETRPRRLVLREAAVAEGAQRNGGRVSTIVCGRIPCWAIRRPEWMPHSGASISAISSASQRKLGRLAVGTRRLQEFSGTGSGGGAWSVVEEKVVVVVASDGCGGGGGGGPRHLRGGAIWYRSCCWARRRNWSCCSASHARAKTPWFFLSSTTIWERRGGGGRAGGEGAEAAAAGVEGRSTGKRGEARGSRGRTCWWRVCASSPLRRLLLHHLDLRVQRQPP